MPRKRRIKLRRKSHLLLKSLTNAAVSDLKVTINVVTVLVLIHRSVNKVNQSKVRRVRLTQLVSHIILVLIVQVVAKLSLKKLKSLVPMVISIQYFHIQMLRLMQ